MVDSSYFSVVTLTIFGYGDIVSASGLAKMLVLIEVFTGFTIVVLLITHVDKVPPVDLDND
jgi:voltage-gated potassium channel Kch